MHFYLEVFLSPSHSIGLMKTNDAEERESALRLTKRQEIQAKKITLEGGEKQNLTQSDDK